MQYCFAAWGGMLVFFLRKMKLSQKMFLGFGVITLLMLGVLGYAFANFIKQSRVVEDNLHTYNVIREVDGMITSLVNMETGARGYALAGKDDFLEPFNQGKADYEQHYEAIKALTWDDPQQQERLDKLQSGYESWLEWETGQLVTGRQKVLAGQSKMEDLIAVVQSGTGKKDMDRMRAILEDMVKEEEGVLKIRSDARSSMEKMTALILSLGGVIAAILAMLIAAMITRAVITPVVAVTNTFKEISQGDANLEVRLAADSNDELGDMARYFNTFVTKLKDIIQDNKKQSWIKTGQAELNEKLRGEQGVEQLATNAVTYVSKYVNAQIGAIYIKTGDNVFKLFGSYAYKRRGNLSNEIRMGEGLMGQSALEKRSILITDVPEDYIKISSGMGEAAPANILVAPCLHNHEVKCLVELGSFYPFTDMQLEFIEQISESIAVSIHSAEARVKMQELLCKTLEQSEELQVQQEELRQSNEELEEQTKALKASELRLQTQQEELKQYNEELEEQTRALKESESRLQVQQEELRITNEELAERTKSLEIQKNDISIKNDHLKNAQVEIEEKAKALEIASKYKSEFLANMSHELRTPLNSILVLSQMLANKTDHEPLTNKQIEFAKTIYSSGEDLLKLINDILDLSKVEAGKMDVIPENVDVRELAQYVDRSFRPIAVQKGLNFIIHIDNSLPESIISDMQRVQQIINNLLSNAFKFTHDGGITMAIGYGDTADVSGLEGENEKKINISIADTGIGIPLEKQEVIFEAFKQSDGTTSRKYGGTGLGLSISRELAHLLGGRIYLKSEDGKGSTFTLELPCKYESFEESFAQSAAVKEQDRSKIRNHRELPAVSETMGNEIKDDREKVSASEKLLLIIEDDKNFSSILLDLSHEKGFKCIVANNGTEGIRLAGNYKPDAILLDIGLPDITGWKVIEQLKENEETENIPVHIVSGGETRNRQEKPGDIIGYLQKPVTLEKLDEVFNRIEELISKPCKKLLLLDENREQVEKVTEVISKKGIQVQAVDSGAEALKLLNAEQFDCIILDLMLKDMTGLEFLTLLRNESMTNIPVIIHTEKSLTQEDEAELHKYVESIVIKGSKSLERLVAEASLFLHDVNSKIEEKKIKAIRSSQEKEASLNNKKILIVDDDMRNVFALSSILEEKGVRVIVGRNGREGIQKLDQNPDTDLILMDIMMPEMDGYTAMREIRKEEKSRRVPIIALTAKAMKDDRQKCIEAGANDYLVKPIEVDRLISLLRVWLYK